jgi:hypothetical protein
MARRDHGATDLSSATDLARAIIAVAGEPSVEAMQEGTRAGAAARQSSS